MLGYVIHEDRGDPNARMAEIAMSVMADGFRLAGAVQANLDPRHRHECDVELTILGASSAPLRISQSLGRGSHGCRLDSDALERAVAMVAARLTRTTDLLIINKFGKQEASGRGFRDLIGLALSEGVPVLTAVPPAYLPAFLEFADGMAVRLDWDGATDWARGKRPAAA